MYDYTLDEELAWTEEKARLAEKYRSEVKFRLSPYEKQRRFQGMKHGCNHQERQRLEGILENDRLGEPEHGAYYRGFQTPPWL